MFRIKKFNIYSLFTKHTSASFDNSLSFQCVKFCRQTFFDEFVGYNMTAYFAWVKWCSRQNGQMSSSTWSQADSVCQTCSGNYNLYLFLCMYSTSTFKKVCYTKIARVHYKQLDFIQMMCVPKFGWVWVQ